MAKENPNWGYLWIAGELLKLRCKVGKTSVRRILREANVYPKPTKPSSKFAVDDRPWHVFLNLHMNTLVACDFFCKTIWTPFGKRQAFLLMFIHAGIRKVWVSPATYHPDAAWVQQQGRNALMWLEDEGIDATHLLHDRDKKFTKAFDQLMKISGIQIVRSPIQAPNANAFAEAWIASIRRECLDHFMCFSLRHIDHIVYRYVDYYNTHRPHQGLGNRVLASSNQSDVSLTQLNSSIGTINY